MKLRLATLFALLVFSNSGNFLYAQWSTIPSVDNAINAYPNQNWNNGFFFYTASVSPRQGFEGR